MKKQLKTEKPELSIVILSFNTKKLLRECLVSLEKVKNEANFEIIVVDNSSSDGSADMVKRVFPNVKLIKNTKNLGFAAGNNSAQSFCKGELVLFLNSDTLVKKNTLKQTVKYINKKKKTGAVTCKIILPDGSLDKDARRSFPTPWVALTHFSGLDRLFPKSKTLSKYWYGYMSPDQVHEVDVLQGAYFMTRKEILDDIGWFDEDYFLDGEDIDLCWRIKKNGWKVTYYPKVSIVHVKKASKKNSNNQDRQIVISAGVESMEIFYKKNMYSEYPMILNYLIIFSIRMFKYLRLLRTN